MTAAALAGCGLGLGLYLAVRGAWPRRLSLAGSLALVRDPQGGQHLEPAVGPSEAAWRLRLGGSVAALFRQAEVEFRSVRANLEVMGRSLEGLLAEKVLVAVLAPLLVAAAAGILALSGAQLPPLLPVLGLLLAAIGGFFLPDLALRSQAAQRRRAFRHATGAFLDLVATNLAGGSGVEGALHSAARTGQGWAFARLRDALAHAELAGETPWAALGRLGERLDVSELRELAASLVLAGNEGAKVRQSITAKATALRHHQLAETEREAAQATERMSLPVALLLLGFLMFLGFPAVMRVVAGL